MPISAIQTLHVPFSSTNLAHQLHFGHIPQPSTRGSSRGYHSIIVRVADRAVLVPCSRRFFRLKYRCPWRLRPLPARSKNQAQAPRVSAAVRRGGSSMSGMPQSGFPDSALLLREGAPPHTQTRHFHGVISCQRWASPGRWTRSTPRGLSPSIT